VASREALAFFESEDIRNDDNDELVVSKKKYQAIIGGHLHGYNEPSDAKYLFRAFTASNDQPWPNNKKDFQSVSTQLADRLHTLLLDCWTALLMVDKRSDNTTTTPKRLKRDLSSRNGCPLDYFLYHGTTTNAYMNNCSEHVDRGVLICICLSNVPGLEILQNNGKWVCPEEILKENDEAGSLVCILAGQQLNDMLLSKNGSRRNDADSIPPCIHRVRNSLPQKRLSITYEWRCSNVLLSLIFLIVTPLRLRWEEKVQQINHCCCSDE